MSNNGPALATPLLIKPPASALARALNIASKKLFGSPTGFTSGSPGSTGGGGSPASMHRRLGSESSNPNSPRLLPGQLPDVSNNSPGRPTAGLLGRGKERTAQDETELLAQLEGLARKAHVLAEWADRKFDKVEASPSSECSSSQLFSQQIYLQGFFYQSLCPTQRNSRNKKVKHPIEPNPDANAKSRSRHTLSNASPCTSQ